MQDSFSQADLDDILANPKKYGAPTFQEFSKNPDKYVGRKDANLTAADVGSHILRKSNLVEKHIYEVDGYRCNSIEEVERVALSQGLKIDELAFRPEIIPLGGGKCNLLVKFTSKNREV